MTTSLSFDRAAGAGNKIQQAVSSIRIDGLLVIEMKLEYHDNISKYTMRILHLVSRGREYGGKCEMLQVP